MPQTSIQPIAVLGHSLHRIPYTAQNEVNGLDWTREAKKVAGTAFLISTREQTGFRR